MFGESLRLLESETPREDHGALVGDLRAQQHGLAGELAPRPGERCRNGLRGVALRPVCGEERLAHLGSLPAGSTCPCRSVVAFDHRLHRCNARPGRPRERRGRRPEPPASPVLQRPWRGLRREIAAHHPSTASRRSSTGHWLASDARPGAPSPGARAARRRRRGRSIRPAG